MTSLQCYNKGCGQTYDDKDNTDGACTFHPGVPVFHDALKGWSCCKKRSTDFTEFLNIPGCTKGRHSNDKPKEPEKAEPEKKEKEEVIVYKAPRMPSPVKEPMARPSADTPLIKLPYTVGATLKTALEKAMKSMNIQDKDKEDGVEGEVPVGTSCKNNACKGTYENESSNSETCNYHPGCPIFHEGLKFWSCCQRKTTEFDNFLAQEGCTEGKHLWIKEKVESEEKVSCRYDWHQTGGFVIVSIFSKVAVPEKCSIEANQVSLKISISFEGGKKQFENNIILKGVIDPSQSTVKMLGTKVEINLKKAEPGSWTTLELRDKATES